MRKFERLRFSLRNISFVRGFFISFALGFIVRFLPGVLSYPYPIGFDTVYYAARIQSGMVLYHWSFLLYAFLVPVYVTLKTDPFLLLRLTAPLLYGLNVSGIYFFARKALGWHVRKSLITGVIFAFQLAALRISWDLYRNTLGLGVLLFTLPWIQKVETFKGFTWLVSLSMLVTLSHEYASVIMFSVVLGIVIKDLLKGARKRAFRVVVAILPASAIFLAGVYFYFTIFPTLHTETNIIYDTPQPSPGSLFFLANYLKVASPSQYYPTYLDLFSHVFSLFGLLYLLCLPLIFVGFFRSSILDSWILLLFVGSFSALVIPFFALDVWSRWMFMLVYPFAFYSVNGVWEIWESSSRSVVPGFQWLRWRMVSKITVLGILFCVGLLGSLFITVRYGEGGVFYTPNTILYLPSTMLHNTIPLQDVNDTVKAIEWLNGHMNNGSSALVHQAFVSWARLYLDKKNVIVYYARNVETALNTALGRGFSPLYLIWWNENTGWYGLTVPKGFASVFSSGRISVFKYSQQ